jgi:hypothetical protein
MNRSRPAIVAILLLAATASADAQQRVYQWKDAKGVTHYTDMPPPQAHSSRDISSRSGTATEAATVKPAESQQCLDARANVARLKGGGELGVDTDGDGKADRMLSAEERTAQTELNEAAVKAYCAPSKP